MRLFQCIHRYPPHIPAFEERNKIREKDYTFDQIVQLLLKDGYASTYILNPEYIPESDHQLFFTIWDYAYLQELWASENGLKTKDLEQIKLAQIEAFQPDVFYNHSPRYDNNFVDKLPKDSGLLKICWDAVVTTYPPLHKKYDARLTLFQPFVDYWKSRGLFSTLLPGSYLNFFDDKDNKERPIDLLFYGQYIDQFYIHRNNRIQQLLKWLQNRPYQANIHLQYAERLEPYVDRKIIRRFTRFKKSPPPLIRNRSLPSIYGEELYQTIARSKLVINWFGDYNGLYRDNMRNYEAISGGALLISEDGIYPEGLVPEEDFLTFKDTEELFTQIDNALTLPDQGSSMASKAKEKLKTRYSKSVQWRRFQEVINQL